MPLHAYRVRARRAIFRVLAERGLIACVLTCTFGCSLADIVNNSQLPTDAVDPSAIKTPEGAMKRYSGTLVAFHEAVVGGFVSSTGALSDELRSVSSKAFPEAGDALDSRTAHEQGFSNGVYVMLQRVRGHAREARAAFRSYYSAAPSALVGHLFAIEAMANVLLAELYCSGIPLSLLEFEGDYVLKPGSSSEEVYQQALVLFDSAVVLASDSSRIAHFANLGRARAFLGLHDLRSAAQAVSSVPVNYVYQVAGTAFSIRGLDWAIDDRNWSGGSVADGEGRNGLKYVTGGDPRTASESLDGGITWRPSKYRVGSSSGPGLAPIVVASGIEARLIEAEAALAEDNPTWLSLLNALRTSCTVTDDCSDPAPAGTGGIGGLSPLRDRSAETLPIGKTKSEVRVDMLFEERAAWLFLTGHRQGDLRRLVAQYGRPAETVYPIGAWGVLQQSFYGTDVNLPVDPREQVANPLYRGCLNRDA